MDRIDPLWGHIPRMILSIITRFYVLSLITWKRKTPRIILWNTLESRFVVVHWLFSCRQMFPWTGFTPHFGSRPTFIKTAYWRRIWHPPDIGYKRFIPSDKQPGNCHLPVDVGKPPEKLTTPDEKKLKSSCDSKVRAVCEAQAGSRISIMRVPVNIGVCFGKCSQICPLTGRWSMVWQMFW